MKYSPVDLRAILDVSKYKVTEKGSLFFYPSLNSSLGHHVLFMLVGLLNTEISSIYFGKFRTKGKFRSLAWALVCT